jgi:hypothetical protein
VRTCLIALPMMRSDSPFEYTFAVSHVVTPRSHAALRSGRACGLYEHGPRCALRSANLVFVDDPGRPLVRAEAHRAENGHGDTEAGLAEPAVLDLRLFGGHCAGFGLRRREGVGKLKNEG